MGAQVIKAGTGYSIGVDLDEVRAVMANVIRQTTLSSIISDYKGLMGAGKMLRARVAFRVGPASGVPRSTLVHAGAAVEMIHAASLLHDDVIDGGYLRRNAPTFWVERGVPGAILLGDLLLFKALDLMCSIEDGRLTHVLVRATGEVCEAETEQELILRGNGANWDDCVSIARRKTGALFAFIAYVCGGKDPRLSEALMLAGSKIGTAYQLADDVLDATGDAGDAGKTLGSDEARSKTTAMTTLNDSIDPVAYIEGLCAEADDVLAPWPQVQRAWREYMATDYRPALDKNLACFSR